MRNHIAWAILLLSCLLVAQALPGCTSSGKDSQAAPPPVRPIDRVRAGMLEVNQNLDATLLAAQAAVNPTAASRDQHRRFRSDLKTLDASVTALRQDCSELRDRANEYLSLWSGETVTITAGGAVGGQTNSKRARAKAKYDQMVSALQQARDQALPLLDDLATLDASLDNTPGPEQSQALRLAVQRMSAQSQSTQGHLNAAIACLDELKSMLASNSRSQ